ncbi:LacI family DNA-binding transcriptional regulator [Candidatus Sumerlaeota bacterium]|nr:LacI family DNA-binding transcriptional regulator [Candidatus Sumerlaeota bacterium]
MKKKNVTIKDIAEQARTSVATVSRVLSEKPGVVEKKRELIQRLVSEMGYEPNRNAQNLAGCRTNLLGFITSDLKNPWKVDLMRRMEQFCRERGKQILVANSAMRLDLEQENIKIMQQNRVEGLIIFPVSEWKEQEGDDHLLTLKARRYPFILMGRLEDEGFDIVCNDDIDAGRCLARRLIEWGHRRILLCGRAIHMRRSNRNKRLGVEMALREAGLSPEESLMTLNMAEENWTEELLRLQRQAERPTACIVVNSERALEIYHALLQAKIRIPEDCSLGCFDDNLWCKHLVPPLTLMTADDEQLAQAAFDALSERMDHPEKPRIRRLLPMRYVERESCGPAPAAR